MTNKEAINTLGNLRRYVSGGGVVDRSVDGAIKMAIEALELKMPKKPIYEEIDKYIKNRFITVTLCPSCAREIVTGDMYCIMCGQAIDWEEE